MSKKGEVCNSLTVSLQHWEYQSIFQFWAVRQMRQKLFSVGFLFSPSFTSYKLSFFLLSLIAFSPPVSINISLPFLISSLGISSFLFYLSIALQHKLNSNQKSGSYAMWIAHFLNCSTGFRQALKSKSSVPPSAGMLDSDPWHQSLCCGAGRRWQAPSGWRMRSSRCFTFIPRYC